ncbi:MAG: precorrin-2 dehydrogenase/sirohydrochlorin ferrochelatase family protein [Actinomycetota bacterium]
MPFSYPVSLEAAGRVAMVIGEDAVRHGKADTLLSAGARVTVVAQGPVSVLARLVGEGATVLRRDYLPGDLAGAFLCVASSDDPGVRSAIFREAEDRGVLTNVMDDNVHCHFAAPAVVRRGDLVIAISTGGRSPALARRLREDLEERFGPAWAELLNVVSDVRTRTLSKLPDLAERSRRWSRALDIEELEKLIRAGRAGEARSRLEKRVLEGIM